MRAEDSVKVLFVLILYFVLIPGASRCCYARGAAVVCLVDDLLSLEAGLIIFDKRGMEGGEEPGFLR